MLASLLLALFAAQQTLAAEPATPAATTATARTPDPAAIDRVAASKYWQLLLHFRGGKSDVDEQKFFLSPNGRTDAKAELLATLEAFARPDVKESYVGRDPNQLQHPYCAYPERRRYLAEQLGLSFKPVPCPLLDGYLARFKPEGTTLVFSAAYPYNPGSMFGHTFLRINSAQTDEQGRSVKKMDLLDHGLSYAAAVTGEENSLRFIWNGLMGGFDGAFTVLPYYEKVNEYSNSESRDLWEYELDINAEQTSRILRHVWELEMNGTFDYTFFFDNCSFQILALLEVARPDWDLTSHWFHVIPSETLKRVLNVPGAVRSTKFRPSLYKKAVAKIGELSPAQFAEFEELIQGKKEASADVRVMSAAISYFYYQKQKGNGFLDGGQQQRFEKVLIARSKLKAPEPADPVVDESSRPDLGHYAYRVGTSAGLMKRGSRDGKYYQELQFRFAYHDLLNDDTGFTPFSEVLVGSFSFRTIPGERDFLFEEARLASIVALSPWTRVEKPASWKVLVGYLPAKDVGCDPASRNCKVVHLEGGGGLSVFLDPGQRALAYALVKYQLEIGGALPRDFRSTPGGELGLLWNPWKPVKLELAGQIFANVFTSLEEKIYSQARAQLAVALSRSIDLRASFLQTIPQKDAALRYREAQAGINVYF